MKDKRKKLAAILVLAAMLALVVVIYAGGSLEPSAPPGPIFKTLDEIEPRIPISSVPYTISTPGSYYLTGDLQVEDPDADGISVEANDVTIDLMGYSLIGPGSGTGCGIFMDGRSNVEIRNGSLRDFGSIGINEDSWDGNGHRLVGVRAASNTDNGIQLRGRGHLVKDCTAAENGKNGFYVGNGSTVAGNIAYSNQWRGIFTGEGCMVIGNTARLNNQVDWNDLGGIEVSIGCLVKANILSANKRNNIYVQVIDNVIEENLVTDSGNGIYFYTIGNFYANNRASGNTTNYANTGGNTDGGGNVEF